MKYTALLLTLILTSAQANLTSSSYETAGYIELIIVAIFVGFVFAYPHIKRIYTRKKINVNEIKLIDDIECPGIFFKIINYLHALFLYTVCSLNYRSKP